MNSRSIINKKTSLSSIPKSKKNISILSFTNT